MRASGHIRIPGLRSARTAGRRLPVAALLAIVVLMSACADGEDPAAQDWLHGTWVLTFNPERDDEDDLDFREDGTVQVRTADGRIVAGRYRVAGDELLLALIVNDRPVEVRFDIAPDRSQLTYHNGAYYTKQARP